MIRDEERYRGKLYSFSRDFRHAEGRAVVPLIASELRNIAHEMPVLFTKRGADWFVDGLLADAGLRRPLVGHRGEWLGTYSPFHLRIHPFRRTAADDGWEVAPEKVTSAPARGRPFFLGDGQRAPEYARVRQMLAEADAGRALLSQLACELESAGLLVPLPFNFELSSVTPTLAALFCVDALRLASLPPAELGRLVPGQPSALDLAFASVFSLRLLAGRYAGRSARDLEKRIAALISEPAVRPYAEPEGQPHVSRAPQVEEQVALKGFSLDQSASIDFAGLG